MTFGENSLQNVQIRWPQHQQHQPLSHVSSPRHFRNSLLLTNFLLRESIGGMMIQLPLDAKSLAVNVEQSGKTTR